RLAPGRGDAAADDPRPDPPRPRGPGPLLRGAPLQPVVRAGHRPRRAGTCAAGRPVRPLRERGPPGPEGAARLDAVADLDARARVAAARSAEPRRAPRGASVVLADGAERGRPAFLRLGACAQVAEDHGDELPVVVWNPLGLLQSLSVLATVPFRPLDRTRAGACH